VGLEVKHRQLARQGRGVHQAFTGELDGIFQLYKRRARGGHNFRRGVGCGPYPTT
jgi:hypothetical protein